MLANQQSGFLSCHSQPLPLTHGASQISQIDGIHNHGYRKLTFRATGMWRLSIHTQTHTHPTDTRSNSSTSLLTGKLHYGDYEPVWQFKVLIYKEDFGWTWDLSLWGGEMKRTHHHCSSVLHDEWTNESQETETEHDVIGNLHFKLCVKQGGNADI